MFVSRILELVSQSILRMKKYVSSNNATYYIVNYNDEFKNDPRYASYKSVILSDDEHGNPSKILSFAPPHGIDYDAFKESLDFEMTDDIVANNAIEGTMINLFFDERINSWNIATRGSIGGNNRFYSNSENKTFRSMFMDCLNNATVSLDSAFADWPKTNCYCFVLQHPKNQIVFDVVEPRAYLVAAYEIHNDSLSLDINDYVSSIPITELNRLVNTKPDWNMLVPQPYTFSRRFDELECVFRNADVCMGVMFWNTKTGVRSHMENTKYAELRELRGNHPNMLYHFLELHQSGDVWKFLDAFPRYMLEFKEYYDKIISFAYLVYGAYEKYYIKREREHIPKEYFVHAARIHHEIYLANKKAGQNIHITPLIVKNYVENIAPIKLVHYLQTDTARDVPMLCTDELEQTATQ